MHENVSDRVGDWLWHQFMEWCKHRGVHPRDYNDLFAIVTNARAHDFGVREVPRG